jgi:hypothetical protein
VIGAGLFALPVPGQRARVDMQLLGQPCHHRRRCGGDVVWYEPQPRQRAQPHGQPKAISRRTPTARVHEGTVRRGQRKEPDQLIAGDLRETA